ncbi:MAG: hypothetical protein ACOYNS_03590 [Bacteroidota bacterium]
MKTLFKLSILAALLLNTAAAQLVSEMKVVGDPKEEPSELVSKEIRDDNGTVCAGLIITTDLKGLTFQANNGIVKINQTPGRYFLFLSPDENVIDVFSSDYAPKKLILNELGMRLRSGQTWSIKITGEKSIPVTFIISPNGTKLFIDNAPGESKKTPQLKVGTHAVKIMKQGFVTLIDTINVSPENALFNYELREVDIYDPQTTDDDKTLIKAAVATFKISGELTTDDAFQLQQAFKSDLEGTGKYKIVPLSENELNAIIRQYETGTVDKDAKALLTGIERKTTQVFKGSIGKFANEWTISIQKIDLKEKKMDNSAFFNRFEGSQSMLFDQITIAAQKIAGTYVESSNLWYYVGGAAVLIGGGAAVLLGGKDAAAAPVGTDGLPLPPSKPN